uniref:Natural killer cell triggering receptor n=1 Tax=Erpetoichthys calabaricus TaxID=27687 RepID=A0A8C4SBD5_ERPCA
MVIRSICYLYLFWVIKLFFHLYFKNKLEVNHFKNKGRFTNMRILCFFWDENFVLKHDRAFLLSMANRGKDTNGSQFFIILLSYSVHVVFGLIISGFEVIKQIENLKTDAASRPYADVRVIDCGQLITKSANDGKYCSL